MLVSGHCYKCYGAGVQRVRNQYGFISTRTCRYCKGLGRVLMKEHSGEWYISQKIGAIGLTPGIRKGHSAHIRNYR